MDDDRCEAVVFTFSSKNLKDEENKSSFDDAFMQLFSGYLRQTMDVYDHFFALTLRPAMSSDKRSVQQR